jgi:hypothetical protein
MRMSDEGMEVPTVPLSLVAASGAMTILLASALAYVLMGKKRRVG